MTKNNFYMNFEDWDKKWEEIISDEVSFEIDAQIPDSNKVVKLLPLTKIVAQDDYYLSKITEWRLKNSQFFFSEFEPSIERTKTWLHSSFLSSPRNMFFLLHFQNEFIGHCAFKNLSHKSVYLDNLIKGVQGGHAKIIETTVKGLINWLFSQFQIQEVTGSVLANNAYGIISNRKIGFIFSEKLYCSENEYEYYNIKITKTDWNKM
jgi:hypothetical protein